MRKLQTVAALTLWCAFGCARRSSPQAGREALKNADLAFAEATAGRRLSGFSSFLAEDVLSIRPNLPVIRGRPELAQRWAALLNDPAMSITWQPLEAVVSDGGEMGFTVGTYQITRTEGHSRSSAGGGKYITIWKRQPDGSWKVAFDSGVQDTLPAKPAQ
jgi:ketosteroid isomerase-like protein